MDRDLKDFLTKPRRTRRILALDGGGVRGFISLGILTQLEKKLVERSGDPDYRLSQYFDLIGGTSTGSIIATGLALGWKVDRAWKAYLRIVPKVFVSRWASFGIIEPLYPQKPLRDALEDEFKQEQLDSPQLETGLAIFAKSMSTGSAWEWCNNPNWVYFDAPHSDATPNRYFELRSIVQASAAAPHYFKGINIEINVGKQDKKERQGYFIDGGVGGFNNPALELLTMVRDPAYGFNWELGADKLYLFSVGTGWVREKSRFFKDWAADFLFLLQTVKALRGMINDVSLQQIAYLQAMSQVAMPWYINGEKRFQRRDQPGGKAYLTLEDKALLTYQRVDVRLDDADKYTPAGNKESTPLPETPGELFADVERLRAAGDDDVKDEPKRKKLKLLGGEFKGALKIDNAKRKNSSLLSQLGRAAGRRAMQLATPPEAFDPPGENEAEISWRHGKPGNMRNAPPNEISKT